MPNPFADAVADFLQHEAGRAPDYSGCQILVPHHHAAEAFKRALSSHSTAGYVVPPRLLTLLQLGSQMSTGQVAKSSGRLLAELHELLARSRLLPDHSLWTAARELADLIDELDAEGGTPEALGGGGHSNLWLDAEAQIVQTIWAAYRDQDQPGAARIYVQSLMEMADMAERPLYTLGLSGLTRPEADFLSAWQERAAVIDLPAGVPHPERWQLLQSAWQSADAELPARARRYADKHPISPVAGNLALLAAASLEAVANAAESRLMAWLQEGRRNIALIAVDRLLARRLRALAERNGVLIRDETGWALSTAAVSHVVDCWIGLCERMDSHRDLIDLLKSPYILTDSEALRTQALHELESAWRRHGAPASLKDQLAFARHNRLAAAETVLLRLLDAQAGRPGRRDTLSRWTLWLLESLRQIGARHALGLDVIGRELLALIDRLAAETVELRHKVSLGDWRRWLLMQVEAVTFTDESVDSPVRLTHLPAARMRDWDAVLVLGADANRLPARPASGLFNDRVRRQLGLPDAAQRELRQQEMLMDVIARSDETAFVWQRQRGRDPQALSPWLVILDAFHKAAWGLGLSIIEFEARDPGIPGGDQRPAAPAPDEAPARLSVSAWQSLVTCPYQYFARYLLGLNVLDEVPVEMDKADYGSLVHTVLARFHSTHPVLSAHPADELVDELSRLGTEAFARSGRHRYLDELWEQRWLKRLPGYLDWALRWESAGHRFRSAEVRLEKDLAWSDVAHATLYGRADRLDEGAAGVVVLDYKTQSLNTLRRKAEVAGEDVQLSAYALLADAGEAAFVGIDQERTREVAWKGDLNEAAAAEAARIEATLAGLAAGAPMPAQGTPQACAWCEMRGLCRIEHDAA